MAERWKINDSARTMTKKFNTLVDEVNNSQKVLEEQVNEQSTAKTGYAINGLTDLAVNEIIGSQRISE